MKAGVPFGRNTIQVDVYDQKWDETVRSTTNVEVIYVFDESLENAGSVRLSGIKRHGEFFINMQFQYNNSMKSMVNPSEMRHEYFELKKMVILRV